jgi:hypothetical protein
MLYSRLSATTLRSEEQLKRRRSIEVAEFFGPDWISYASGKGQAPAFEGANHFSRIYLPTGGEPAIWDNPVVAPGGVSTRFYQLDSVAVDILERRGFRTTDRRGRGGSTRKRELQTDANTEDQHHQHQELKERGPTQTLPGPTRTNQHNVTWKASPSESSSESALRNPF